MRAREEKPRGDWGGRGFATQLLPQNRHATQAKLLKTLKELRYSVKILIRWRSEKSHLKTSLIGSERVKPGLNFQERLRWLGNKRATPPSEQTPQPDTFDLPRSYRNLNTFCCEFGRESIWKQVTKCVGYAEGLRKALTIPLVYSFIVSGLLKQYIRNADCLFVLWYICMQC